MDRSNTLSKNLQPAAVNEVRVRVVVDRALENGRSVLLEGTEVGTQVVVDGAPELFGVEFGND